MKPGISFSKVWFDDDVVELKIDSFDGKSLFSNNVYAGHQDLDDLVAGLFTFKDHVHGGIYDIELGSFGPEYARGAFRARLHFQESGKIYITIAAQSEFEEFGIKNVASEATLYLRSEPALLDNFIGELKALAAGKRDDANLEAA
jgi:hypothetical protein